MRRFTVTALGPEPPRGVPPLNEAVSQMKQHWESWLDKILPDQPDLIVLPECGDRFPDMSMDDRGKYYAERGNTFAEFFSRKAALNNCMISYSAVRQVEDGSIRNVTTLFGRDGKKISDYYKYYPVIFENTAAGVEAGNEAVVADTEFGRIGFITCFDLNFMDLLDLYVKKNPDLLIFSSMYHGGHVQNHWAYTCRSYFVGCVPFRGQCSILDPLGTNVASSTNYYPYVTASVNTDFEVAHLDDNWEKLLAARKKYGKAVQVSEPGRLGCVLISSESPDITAKQVVDEFEITRLDEYFANVRKFFGRA